MMMFFFFTGQVVILLSVPIFGEIGTGQAVVRTITVIPCSVVRRGFSVVILFFWYVSTGGKKSEPVDVRVIRSTCLIILKR